MVEVERAAAKRWVKRARHEAPRDNRYYYLGLDVRRIKPYALMAIFDSI